MQSNDIYLIIDKSYKMDYFEECKVIKSAFELKEREYNDKTKNCN